ncbi:Arginyl-tRNA--protein transferase 1 [Thelohanellus kitauei]|uniref:arginyltransferase n=1 Tax=Thelohanellus kitauei TaxID=669202 RepID=A0A0C2ML38_THEKT|nr:Arginyl-tRNA--protein transferase 1 [Thelohanellus kitauei]
MRQNEKSSGHYYGLQGPNLCGYCGLETDFVEYMYSYCLRCADYEKLIERGFMRDIFKKVPTSCCIAYQTRYRALDFIMTKSQKRVLKKFRKFATTCSLIQITNKGKSNKSKSLKDFLDDIVVFNKKDSSKFNIISYPVNDDLVLPKTVFDQSFQIYNKYQNFAHCNDDMKITKNQFSTFLCESCLVSTSMTGNYYGFEKYGTHMLHYVFNDNIMAVSVIDILPSYVYSVYFCYDPQFKSLSLGTLSTLIEIRLVQILNEHLSNIQFYSMGYYVNCPKILYKSNFHPFELLCPVTFKWVPFEMCKYLDLNKHEIKSFNSSR